MIMSAIRVGTRRLMHKLILIIVKRNAPTVERIRCVDYFHVQRFILDTVQHIRELIVDVGIKRGLNAATKESIAAMEA